jgi:hypothetical protein
LVGLTDNYLVRQEFEDKREELLAESGLTGIERELRQRIRERRTPLSALNATSTIRKTRNSSGAKRALEKSFEKMGKGYARALNIQLKKDRVIPKK